MGFSVLTRDICDDVSNYSFKILRLSKDSSFYSSVFSCSYWEGFILSLLKVGFVGYVIYLICRAEKGSLAA